MRKYLIRPCLLLSLAGIALSFSGCKLDDSVNKLEIRGVAQENTIYLCSDGAWHNLFERSRMRQEVQTMIKMKRNKQLGDYLQKQDPFDDCTFITMELKKKSERNYA